MERITYSVAEVAELLGISRGSVYNYIRDGEIRSVTLGSRIVIPRRVIEELVNVEQAS